MDTSVWIGMGTLFLAFFVSVVGSAITYGKLTANVQHLTNVVQKLVAETQLDGNAIIEMRTLVMTLKDTVQELQTMLRTGFSERMLCVERRLDHIEVEHKHNHPE